MCGRETFRMERIVKLFVRFRPLCLQYLQPTTTRLQMSKFWRCFQNTDSQPFEFYKHEFDAGNRPERAQTVLKKGHSCDTTVALLAFNCGSFADSKRLNEKIARLFLQFKVGFPFRLEIFGGCTFVHIIHRHPRFFGAAFHRSLSVRAQGPYSLPRQLSTVPLLRAQKRSTPVLLLLL